MPIDLDCLSLEGKTAIVTGAAMGLGAAIALAYARFGARLALCDRAAPELEEIAAEARGQGAAVSTAVFDVRDAPAVEAFVSSVVADAPEIHVLVNNAGGTFFSNFEQLSPGGERALVDENWSSVSHFLRACTPHLADGASVINVTSIEAHRAGPGYAVYSAMKAAVASLTKSLALELGGRRIRVNNIAPDVIATPGLATGQAAGAGMPGTGAETTFAATPLARTGHPDDVAGAALYLASDLSGFVTGTTLHVDGGNHAAAGWRKTGDGTFAP